MHTARFVLGSCGQVGVQLCLLLNIQKHQASIGFPCISCYVPGNAEHPWQERALAAVTAGVAQDAQKTVLHQIFTGRARVSHFQKEIEQPPLVAVIQEGQLLGVSGGNLQHQAMVGGV
jgi:hypothetical protein